MTDRVVLLNEALEGRYRIERELGEGGMATVYLAEDIKHERMVALKVLKPELAAAVGADRFLSEIKTTANLQHPHILPLFDSGQAGSFLYYVMPYVEGESLRTRIQRESQLPVAEAVRITISVAHALDYAHRCGVVHRDVKPANLLLHDGEPLVADFGIALALGDASGRLTETGLSLGTPHYMSPEQATGDRAVGPAADVFSLGCVLYEMLAGEPPYTGRTAQAVLGKIISGAAPPVTAHRKTVPPNVEAAIRSALEPVPADRLPSAEAFARALSDEGFRLPTPVGHVGAVAAEGGGLRPRWVLAAVAVSLVLGGVFGRSLMTGGAPDRPSARYRLGFEIAEAPLRSTGLSIAQTPDGATLVYVGPPAEEPQLWIKQQDELHSRPVRGTVGGTRPFFSPDGGTIGFLAPGGSLKTVPTAGGDPLTLVASGVLGYGAAWSDDGYIYFDADDRQGLMRVASSGGARPEVVAKGELSPDVLGHAWPDPLPSGRGVIHTIVRNHLDDLIVALDVETGEQRVLVEGTIARYAHSGHLVYVERSGSLLAAPFDANEMRLTGPSVLLEELGEGFTWDLSLSRTGRLVYGGQPAAIHEVVWVDRTGAESPLDAETPMRGIRFVSLSPDGRWLAANTWPARPRDDGQVWIKDLSTGAYQRLTFEGEVNFRPGWTPDSRFVTFVSDRLGNRDVWIKPVDGSGDATLLLDDVAAIDEAQLSSDGQSLIYRRGMEDGERDIYLFRPGTDSAVSPLVNTPFDETEPALSPDGRWLAYTADVDGQADVYVRRFPEAGDRRRVSLAGGISPVWSRDGRELFYVSDGDSLVARPVLSGSDLRLGDPTALFSTYPYRTDFYHQSFDVAADGRVVMIRIDATEQLTESLVVVENWLDELRRRLPPG